MKIPTKLKIGGLDWTVKINHDVNHESGTWGSTHHASQTIFLDQDLNEQKMAQVFLHELLHAALDTSGYTAHLHGDEEEKLVRGLEGALYQILRDNRLEFYDG